MGLARFAALSAFLFPALVACNEDNTFGLGDSPSRQVFTAAMTGLKVRPIPVATTTTAIATVTIRQPNVGEVGRQLTYAIVATNLTSAISAHIHLGGAAIGGGPILVTLYTNPTDSVLTSQTLVTGLIPEGALGFGLDSLAALMTAGAAYVDIHAIGYLPGLVRGQLSKKGEQPPLDLFSAAALTGAKERPTPVVTTATGSATFELLSDSTIRQTDRSLDLNAAYTRRSGNGTIAARNATIWAISFAGPAIGPIGWGAELSGTLRTTGPSGEPATYVLLAGPTFSITSWLALDAGFSVQLNEDHPYQINFGGVWNVGKIWP